MVGDDGSARGGAQDTRPPSEATPASKTSRSSNVPLPHLAADLSDDKIEDVLIDAALDHGSGIGKDRDAEPADNVYEEDEE